MRETLREYTKTNSYKPVSKIGENHVLNLIFVCLEFNDLFILFIPSIYVNQETIKSSTIDFFQHKERTYVLDLDTFLMKNTSNFFLILAKIQHKEYFFIPKQNTINGLNEKYTLFGAQTYENVFFLSDSAKAKISTEHFSFSVMPQDQNLILFSYSKIQKIQNSGIFLEKVALIEVKNYQLFDWLRKINSISNEDLISLYFKMPIGYESLCSISIIASIIKSEYHMRLNQEKIVDFKKQFLSKIVLAICNNSDELIKMSQMLFLRIYLKARLFDPSYLLIDPKLFLEKIMTSAFTEKVLFLKAIEAKFSIKLNLEMLSSNFQENKKISSQKNVFLNFRPRIFKSISVRNFIENKLFSSKFVQKFFEPNLLFAMDQFDHNSSFFKDAFFRLASLNFVEKKMLSFLYRVFALKEYNCYCSTNNLNNVFSKSNAVDLIRDLRAVDGQIYFLPTIESPFTLKNKAFRQALDSYTTYFQEKNGNNRLFSRLIDYLSSELLKTATERQEIIRLEEIFTMNVQQASPKVQSKEDFVETPKKTLGSLSRLDLKTENDYNLIHSCFDSNARYIFHDSLKPICREVKSSGVLFFLTDSKLTSQEISSSNSKNDLYSSEKQNREVKDKMNILLTNQNQESKKKPNLNETESSKKTINHEKNDAIYGVSSDSSSSSKISNVITFGFNNFGQLGFPKDMYF